jgi:hypothetical protein
LPYRQPVFQDFIVQDELVFHIFHAGKYTGMAHAELAVANGYLDVWRQFEQAYIVGNGASFFAHAVGHLFLGECAFIHESFVAETYLNGVEVFPLQVFQQGQFQEFLVVYLADV